MNEVHKEALNIYEKHTCIDELKEMIGSNAESEHIKVYDERDAILLAYPDHIYDDVNETLKILKSFISTNYRDSFNILHILPPYFSSGDSGFSPENHIKIDPRFGTWDDIKDLSKEFDIIIDVIMNHVSVNHEWFNRYMAGDPDYDDFFIEISENENFSKVTRSRKHPPVSVIELDGKVKSLWTRYSSDQIDLNYKNPEVLVKILLIIKFYLSKGISGLRLDAIAFIWKELHSSCCNLPQTRSILKLIRKYINTNQNNAILISETDIVNGKNNYIDKNELSNLAYRYEVAPLILHLILSRKSLPFKTWIKNISSSKFNSHSLNFLCTHDSIYLRPKNPPLDDSGINFLIEKVEEAGGFTIWRDVNGIKCPYELNIALFDLLKGEAGYEYDFLLVAFILLFSIPGIPLVFFGSLFCIKNNHILVEQTNETRNISRGRIHLNEALDLLENDNDFSEYHNTLTSFLKERKKYDAFHPDSKITLHDTSSDLIIFDRIGYKSNIRFHLLLSEKDRVIKIPPQSNDFIDMKKLPQKIKLAPFKPLLVVMGGK